MHTAMFHSVNSGLFFCDGKNGLLVDGIHQGREEGCSPMPDFLSLQLRKNTGLFAHLTGVLFTHLHHDHYDEEGLESLLHGRPDLPVYGPRLRRGGAPVRPIRANLRTVRMGGAYILARDTRHDGARYREDPHQSYLIRMGGERFFVAGDAALRRADAADFAGFYPEPVSAAFCNLYQLASPEGLDFLRALAPERIFLYHLPFQADDHYHYRQLARQAARACPADLPRPERLEHMAWVDGRAADWENIRKGAENNGLSGVAQHGSLL